MRFSRIGNCCSGPISFMRTAIGTARESSTRTLTSIGKRVRAAADGAAQNRFLVNSHESERRGCAGLYPTRRLCCCGTAEAMP